MNYYLDFEATQFSNKIISIGCVTEDGSTFYSLVKPVNKAKLTKFITELTGITKDDLDQAPTVEDVFKDFKNFIRDTNIDGEETFFFVYGNADKNFLRSTAAFCANNQIRRFMFHLANSLIDFSKSAEEYFHEQIGLRRALEKIFETPVEQNHNSLKDAMLLKTLVETLPDQEYESTVIEEEIYNIVATPTQGMLRANPKATTWEFANTEDALNYIIQETVIDTLPAGETVSNKTKDRIIKKIYKAIKNNDIYCGRIWKKG